MRNIAGETDRLFALNTKCNLEGAQMDFEPSAKVKELRAQV